MTNSDGTLKLYKKAMTDSHGTKGRVCVIQR